MQSVHCAGNLLYEVLGVKWCVTADMEIDVIQRVECTDCPVNGCHSETVFSPHHERLPGLLASLACQVRSVVVHKENTKHRSARSECRSKLRCLAVDQSIAALDLWLFAWRLPHWVVISCRQDVNAARSLYSLSNQLIKACIVGCRLCMTLHRT